MKNTIVKHEGSLEGKEFLDAQFCPTKGDTRKAVLKFFKKYHEAKKQKVTDKAHEALTMVTIEKGGVTIECNETTDWMRISFDKL